VSIILRTANQRLSPSIHKYDDVFIYSGLSAASDELSRAE